MNKIYTFGHSAKTIDQFKEEIETTKIDLLVDLRVKPQSRYYPHFNRSNLESYFGKKYIFGGEFLGGSAEFHNDLLEYISCRGINENNPNNKLFTLIDGNLRDKIFSKETEFSNNEKRKFWITENFLSHYIPNENRTRAVYFLKNLFKKFPNQNICFFCSEKNHQHCHRYHLLEKDWLSEFDVEVEHLEE